MIRREKSLINDLQKNEKNIRNFCILAHVDHGKTTLADTLLATNAIISNRMSGKLRYMDSRQDEQQRGITMKSSAISLIHKYSSTSEMYLINLIDSPGHVDFSTEVSTAVRLCDGAAILIDVCEGICPQTHAVLRQAWLENLKLVLVFNKIDRLILELKMTPLEAYIHMDNILGQFNAIVAQQFTSLLLEKNSRLSEQELDENVIEADEEIDESKLYFSPKYNNVFFASSIDGWGFSIKHFADIYASKLGFKRDTLLNTLWGDFYLNAKTKRIMKNAQSNGKKPLFVQLVLDNLWQVYDAVFTRRDTVMTEKILTSLNLKMNPRDLKYTDPKGPIQALFFQWLPIGRNLLDMIVDVLPSPVDITSEKVEHLISSKIKPFNSLPKQTQNLKSDFMKCDPNGTLITFISKMFATEKENIVKKHQMSIEDLERKRELIRQRKLQEEAAKSGGGETVVTTSPVNQSNEEQTQVVEEETQEYIFLAFARVFSGTLKKGQELFILSPKHNPEDFVGKEIDINSDMDQIQAVSKHVQKLVVKDLYLMMGRELEAVDEVPCGNIVAIGGLEQHCLKSATLSSTLFCPSFADMYLQTAPILRVAIEPKNPSRMKDLMRGLKLLNQADPCVEIVQQENGENILCTAGEVHLQRCLEDLVNLFAKCEVNVSQPIIPFKETILKPVKSSSNEPASKPSETNNNSLNQNQNNSNANNTSITTSPSAQSTTTASQITSGADGSVELQSADKRVRIQVRARPLPLNVTQFLEENSSVLKVLIKLNQNKLSADLKDNIELVKKFKEDLAAKFKEAAENDEFYASREWTNAINRIVSFGPNRNGPNMLINTDDELNMSTVWSVLESSSADLKSSEYETSIVFGFNLATAKGPICEEPMQGVVFFIDKFQVQQQQQVNLDESNPNDLESSLAELDLSTAGSVGTAEKQRPIASKTTPNFISLMKDVCKRAFEAQPQRLMAAMYKCEAMTVSSEALGKLYAVLGKRNAKILEETIKDNTNMFLVIAHVPIADSFGMAEEVRKRTSGLATLHLEFSHFEVIEIDPYWEPKTEEELLHYGDKADFENQARKYMNDVRKRKGLFVREKLVEHSEKQRTLTIK